MIPAAFYYMAPTSVDAVLSILSDGPDETKLLAGGQSLIPLLRLRLAAPTTIVDLRRLGELRAVEDLGHAFRVGAMVSHRDFISSDVASAWAIVRDGGADLADPLVRNRGTFGGSIAHADPAGDWPPIALALDATMHVRNLSGSREVRADEFFTDVYATALSETDLLTHVDLPRPTAASASAYVKFAHPASGYAVAAAGAVLAVEDGVCRSARITLTGVCTTPVRSRPAEDALLGRPLTADSFAAAAAVATDGLVVIGDSYAPEAYRRHLAGVAVRRALERSVEAAVHAH